MKGGKKRKRKEDRGTKRVILQRNICVTPESSLKRSLDQDVKKSGLRIRIVEKSGMSVKRVLQLSDPFKKRTCERE